MSVKGRIYLTEGIEVIGGEELYPLRAVSVGALKVCVGGVDNGYCVSLTEYKPVVGWILGVLRIKAHHLVHKGCDYVKDRETA